jgi:hypothetical protein
MTISQSQAPSYLASHHGPLAEGWEEVDTFETLDPDDYELEEVCPDSHFPAIMS